MSIIKVKTRGTDNVTGGGRRNLLMNGSMQVAQRATSATNTAGISVYRTIDRLKLWNYTDGEYTTEQSTVAPDGFSNSVKFQVTTADTSLAAAQYSIFGQNIEAQNLQHLAYGTNSAKTITVSFYVRSNKTGTYALCLEKSDNTIYRYIKEFSISSADTWERKEITIVPDSNIKAAAGAINNDNGIGFRVFIILAMGSDYYSGTTNDAWNSGANAYSTSNVVNWMDNTSNNFYFTGFQVEVGSVATEFEHRSIGEELTLCQRYYYEHIRGINGERKFVGGGDFYVTTQLNCHISFPTTMRTTPTLVQNNGTDFMGWWGGAQSGDISAAFNIFLPSENLTSMYLNPDDDPSSAGIGARVYIKNAANVSGTTGCFLAFNAEL